MRIGIHLPQYGRAAGPEAVSRVARHAEELGFERVWISDHIVHPAEQDYPSPYLIDPFVTLTWAAAVTSTIGLATSVIVVPHHPPLALANTIASLDLMSGGRVTLGVGVGWSAREFEALGQEFGNRGRRLDEIIDLLRAAWTTDPVNHEGPHYTVRDIKVQPKPAHPVPIWVGGTSEAALRRAVEKGDGAHLIGLDADAAAPIVERLRRDRPEPEFTITLRTGWDPQGMDHDQIRREREAWEAAGIQEVCSAPWRQTADDWLRSMDLLRDLVAER